MGNSGYVSKKFVQNNLLRFLLFSMHNILQRICEHLLLWNTSFLKQFYYTHIFFPIKRKHLNSTLIVFHLIYGQYLFHLSLLKALQYHKSHTCSYSTQCCSSDTMRINPGKLIFINLNPGSYLKAQSTFTSLGPFPLFLLRKCRSSWFIPPPVVVRLIPANTFLLYL